MSFKIALIGSGNVASHLAKILIAKGHNIVQVYSRELTHAQALASKINSTAVDQIAQLDPHADFYLICIKDDAIAGISEQCSRVLPPESIIAHTSGVNSPLLINDYFVNRGLFYPLQSFSTNSQPDWDAIPVFVEGSAYSSLKLKELAHCINSNIYSMDDSIRTHLHLASVFANNFTNFNLIIAKQILEKCDVPFEVLLPLMTETITKAFKLGPMQTQTGPAKRMDTGTIEKHIRLLVSEYPEYRSIYKKYALLIMQTFKHANSRTDPTPADPDQRI
ncbi:MAG: DUF2520 domain-containing protein [Saprospiraceae bacterium]|nr:DUF2520 domain-containing protein [Saprospiraceae bacterium]